MSMYSLIEYSNSYAKILKSLWKYCRDEPDDNTANSEQFKSKSRLINNTGSAGTLKGEIVVPLKYLINFCRTLEMALINCEITLDLTWSANCVICEEDRAITFAISDTKLYVPLVTLTIQDKGNLFQQ